MAGTEFQVRTRRGKTKMEKKKKKILIFGKMERKIHEKERKEKKIIKRRREKLALSDDNMGNYRKRFGGSDKTQRPKEGDEGMREGVSWKR